MKRPSQELLTLLATAARLRAGGASWDQVAGAVGRSARTCRGWPRRHPRPWRRLYRRAARDLAAEGEAEARAVLRARLRSANERVSLSAAQGILRHRPPRPARDRRSPTAKDEAVAFFAYLESLSEEQLDDLVAQCLAQRGAAHAVAVSSDPPGARQAQ